MALPYFIPDLPGIGGVLKQRPEDFVVHELPSYEPCGDGEHVMAEIEKTGISTIDAVDLIARKLKVPRRDIGYAGLKDTHAVTRQWVTIRGTTPEAVVDLATDRFKILFVDRHRNKLRLGHLTGNRFSIKVREVDPMKVVTLTPAIRTLRERGVPNYFGPQRFGRRGTNDRIGLAFARQDWQEALAWLLGRPQAGDGEAETAARTAYDGGNLPAALVAWGNHGRDERVALKRLIDGVEPAKVVTGIDRRVQDLWLSALQSRLFNAVVAARLATLDDLLDGDLAFKHDNGATFRVESAAVERPRAQRFEISATGPLVGPRVMTPTGEALAAETAAVAADGIGDEAARLIYGERGAAVTWLDRMPPGVRRPLRVKPDGLAAEAGIDAHGPYIQFDFTLPAGSYATVLLREFMRNDG